MASIVVAGDTSGSATIAAPAVAGTPTLTLPTTSGTLLTTASTTGINGSAISSGIVGQAFGGTGTTTGYYGFKNRIINGAMVIDQRNAGASVVVANNNAFIVDRFRYLNNVGSVTCQQSAIAPAGFINSILLTVGSTNTPSANDFQTLRHVIEGLNVADLGWGTANAQTITLSFWVRSSVTGTYSVGFRNSATNRAYVATYTINSANTWEQKSVTIAGDTTGTWLTTNGAGIYIDFSLGTGSANEISAGSWQASAAFAATGEVNWIANAGATFYITGVQLELGSVATTFDFRPYGTELALCQRYYFKINAIALNGSTVSTTQAMFTIKTPVTMRANPTATYGNVNRITYPTVIDYSGTYTGTTRNASEDTLGFSYNQSSGSTFSQNVPVALNDTTSLVTITGSSEL